MPILYVCRPERSIVVTLWRGAVDVPQWEEHLTRMLNDKDFPQTRSHLVDVRSADITTGIGLPEFQRIIDFLAPHYKAIAGRKAAIFWPGGSSRGLGPYPTRYRLSRSHSPRSFSQTRRAAGAGEATLR